MLYLTQTGSFDNAAIIRQAHRFTRQDQARNLPGFPPKTYAQRFAENLRYVWTLAKDERAERAVTAEQKAKREAEEVARFAADMIDSYPAYRAAHAAIDARG